MASMVVDVWVVGVVSDGGFKVTKGTSSITWQTSEQSWNLRRKKMGLTEFHVHAGDLDP